MIDARYAGIRCARFGSRVGCGPARIAHSALLPSASGWLLCTEGGRRPRPFGHSDRLGVRIDRLARSIDGASGSCNVRRFHNVDASKNLANSAFLIAL